VGDDVFGSTTLGRLREAGVDVSAVEVRPGAATGVSVHLSAPGDRAILTLPGTIPALGADAVRAAADAVRPAHAHVASPYLTPALTAELPELLASWRASGLTTSLDPNWDPAERWDSLAPALRELDVLLPNLAELRGLARAVGAGSPAGDDPGPRAQASALAALRPRVVVKAGGEGGWSLDAAGDLVQVPGLSLDVVDATGAGDTFDAGYIAAIAYGVTEERERVRWAAVAGSLSTRGAGGTAAQPTLGELRAALDA